MGDSHPFEHRNPPLTFWRNVPPPISKLISKPKMILNSLLFTLSLFPNFLVNSMIIFLLFMIFFETGILRVLLNLGLRPQGNSED